MKEVFDISGFKSYLLKDSNRFRADGLSIWYNSIPIPIDIFDSLFSSWPDLFREYLNHLVTSLILEKITADQSSLGLSMRDFPDPESVKTMGSQFYRIVGDALNAQLVFRELSRELATILGLSAYEIDNLTVVECASARGKKYNRLYVPKAFRSAVLNGLPDGLKNVATSNGDMFGNILADYLNLYRAGFNDALSAIFNRLLDYKITRCSGLVQSGETTVLNFGEGGVEFSFVENRTTDGSLWEPYFDGELKVRLNPTHPHFSSIKSCSNPEAVLKILGIMAELEINCENQKQLRTLEEIRSRISRALWR